MINDRYREFELKYNTRVRETYKKSLEWEINGETRVINKEALGRYKRSKVDMTVVLELISFNKHFNGSVVSAKKIINKLKKVV